MRPPFRITIEEGLSPWQVSKFYLPAWSGAGRSYDDDLPPPNATLTIDTGARDPVLGATYAQIAQWSRAGHATQGMGEWVEAAEESCLLHLAWNAFGETAEEASVLDGLPRSLAELASGADDTALRDLLSRTDEKIAAAVAAWPHASRVCEAAADALAALRPALKLAGNSIKHRLLQKERQLARVLFEASGLVVRAAARPTLAAPGSNIAIDLHLDARRRVDRRSPANFGGHSRRAGAPSRPSFPDRARFVSRSPTMRRLATAMPTASLRPA